MVQTPPTSPRSSSPAIGTSSTVSPAPAASSAPTPSVAGLKAPVSPKERRTAQKKQVLLLSPFERDQGIIRNVPEADKYDFHFLSASQDDKGEVDLDGFFQAAKKHITDNDIDAVVSITDIYSMIHAALADALPQIKGPSLDGAFLTLNKYYTHLLADPDPVGYFHIDLSKDLETQVEALGEIQFPMFAKPAAGTGSAFTARIDSREDLMFALEQQRKELPAQTENLYRFFSSCDPQFGDKYDLGLVDLALVEEYVPETTKLTVDGYISNGDITLFAIVDNNYWPDKPDAFESCTFPSSHTKEVQDKAYSLFMDVAGKIRAKGFDNQILDVEMFIRRDGRLQVIEVNGRMFGQFADTYRHTLYNGDNFQLAIKLGLGETPEPMVPKGNFGGNFYISTYGSGRAGELLNFDAIKDIPATVSERFPGTDVELDRIKYHPDSVLPPAGSEGTCLLMANIVARNEANARAAAGLIRTTLLKQPKLSAGFGTY